VAFGDDAAVAGGLVGRSAAGPVFCGDAIADPLTGLESVLAVADSLPRRRRDRRGVDGRVAAGYAAVPAGVSTPTATRRRPRRRHPVSPPRPCADTAAVVDLTPGGARSLR
jgi:crotonobetainyl-CoA:carnitine CoA-transferase CaiB-like acyl-CoA transferase